MHGSTCATYIDCDGVPFWLMEQAIRDVRSRFAQVRVTAYRDWTDPGNRRLMESLWPLDVDLAQVTPHARLSNATDVAIAVDAVERLHTSPTDAVALVGNDGDFTALVRHLRWKGVDVLGYGSRDASAALSDACAHFLRFDSATRAPTSEPIVRNAPALIVQTVGECADDDGWTRLDRFGYAVLHGHGLRAKDVGQRTWTRYFAANPHFECVQWSSGPARTRPRVQEVAAP